MPKARPIDTGNELKFTLANLPEDMDPTAVCSTNRRILTLERSLSASRLMAGSFALAQIDQLKASYKGYHYGDDDNVLLSYEAVFNALVKEAAAITLIELQDIIVPGTEMHYMQKTLSRHTQVLDSTNRLYIKASKFKADILNRKREIQTCKDLFTPFYAMAVEAEMATSLHLSKPLSATAMKAISEAQFNTLLEGMELNLQSLLEATTLFLTVLKDTAKLSVKKYDLCVDQVNNAIASNRVGYEGTGVEPGKGAESPLAALKGMAGVTIKDEEPGGDEDSDNVRYSPKHHDIKPSAPAADGWAHGAEDTCVADTLRELEGMKSNDKHEQAMDSVEVHPSEPVPEPTIDEIAEAVAEPKPAKKPTATVTVKKDNSEDVTVEGDVELKVQGGVTVEHRETVEVSPTAKTAADPVQVDLRESDEDCGAGSEPEADEPVVLVTTPVVKKAVSGVVNHADLGEVSGAELNRVLSLQDEEPKATKKPAPVVVDEEDEVPPPPKVKKAAPVVDEDEEDEVVVRYSGKKTEEPKAEPRTFDVGDAGAEEDWGESEAPEVGADDDLPPAGFPLPPGVKSEVVQPNAKSPMDKKAQRTPSVEEVEDEKPSPVVAKAAPKSEKTEVTPAPAAPVKLFQKAPPKGVAVKALPADLDEVL